MLDSIRSYARRCVQRMAGGDRRLRLSEMLESHVVFIVALTAMGSSLLLFQLYPVGNAEEITQLLTTSILLSTLMWAFWIGTLIYRACSSRLKGIKSFVGRATKRKQKKNVKLQKLVEAEIRVQEMRNESHHGH